MNREVDLPLGLYQVLEEEYVSLHGGLAEDHVIRVPDRSVEAGYRLVRANRDWQFHRGHLKNPVRLFDKLMSARPQRIPATDAAASTGARVRAPVAVAPRTPAVGPHDALCRYLLDRIPPGTVTALSRHRDPLRGDLNALFDHEAVDEGKDVADAATAPVPRVVARARKKFSAEHLTPAQAALGALEDALNTIITTELIYTDERFSGIRLTGPLAAFFETNRSASVRSQDWPRVNRLLLEQAFPDEIELIANVRLAAIQDRLHASGSAALCLSGGGIRSATFALGLLQALARRNLLKEFDYLSTVSGGGYVGSWLTAWLYRDPKGLAGVTDRLANQPPESRTDPDPEPLRYLRSYSNFITPQTGLMSADTWTFVAMYLRNLFLNWTVMIPLLLAFLMIPRLYVSTLMGTPDPSWMVAGVGLRHGLLALGALLSMAAVAYTTINRPLIREQLRVRSPFWFKRSGQGSFLKWCLLPLMTGAVLLSVFWAWSLNYRQAEDAHRWWPYGVFGGVVTLVGWTVAMVILRRFRPGHWRENSWTELVVLLAVGVIGGTLFWGTERLLKEYPPILRDLTSDWRTWRTELYAVLAVPVFLGGFLLAMTLFIGLTSHKDRFPDEDREWWARAKAWILIASVAWLVFSALVIAGPLALTYSPKLLTTAGGLSGLVALIAGRSARTPAGEQPGARGGVAAWIHRIGLPGLAGVFLLVFVATLALLTSALTVGLANLVATHEPAAVLSTPVKALLRIENQFESAGFSRNALQYLHMWSIHYLPLKFTLTVIVLLNAIGWFMAWRIQLNRFTLHAGYRDRLIRAFLGASRQPAERRPNPLTGLDPADNIQMHELRPALFHEGDFANIGALALKLRARADDVSSHLWERLSDKVKSDIESYSADTVPSSSLKADLIEDLNHILQDDERPLFLEPAFQRVIKATTAGTKGDAPGEPVSDDTITNRRVLQSAYSGEIHKKYPPPHKLFHVVNTALNLVGGDNLAWQQRKAEPFSITPLHCGCYRLGYRRSLEYGGEDGISLGTAVAISGAAASSNMGYYTTSPVISMVLTLFNVRLGWWLGNPGPAGAKSFQLPSPKYSIAPVVQEAFGLTDDKNKYVYLSDGGHFENLALYEMVLRRCRIIVVSDGGADHDYQFNDLGNAIRKIRIDLGIPIEFKDVPIRAVKLGGDQGDQNNGKEGSYFAIAQIGYSCVDAGAEDGVLLYLKPAIYGDEPQDVLHYKRSHDTFPHETTADQFFDEAQFESYRALGSFVMTRVLDTAGDTRDLPGVVRGLYGLGRRKGHETWPAIQAGWLTAER
jgi:hypothetical protein